MKQKITIKKIIQPIFLMMVAIIGNKITMESTQNITEVRQSINNETIINNEDSYESQEIITDPLKDIITTSIQIKINNLITKQIKIANKKVKNNTAKKAMKLIFHPQTNQNLFVRRLLKKSYLTRIIISTGINEIKNHYKLDESLDIPLNNLKDYIIELIDKRQEINTKKNKKSKTRSINVNEINKINKIIKTLKPEPLPYINHILLRLLVECNNGKNANNTQKNKRGEKYREFAKKIKTIKKMIVKFKAYKI
jgi:hypothetical protein